MMLVPNRFIIGHGTFHEMFLFFAALHHVHCNIIIFGLKVNHAWSSFLKGAVGLPTCLDSGREIFLKL